MSENTTNDNLLSQQLDEYRLEALLGQGGMACVYRGVDVNLKRLAAIKVIDAPFRNDENYIARFEREARAVGQLKHPNIVGLYRYGNVNGLLYIAMEYIEGADLDTVLADYQAQGKSISPDETVRIIRQICLALDYAHQAGVIHRDIKPSNIMLNQQGDAILTDFGLVLLDQQTLGEIFGTPHYIAPEQAISSAGAVPQSDLYAVGVILYEMFTGKVPFEATHPYDVAMLHLSEPPRPPHEVNPEVNQELEEVILKALAKEPEARYQTGADLANDLEKALHLSPAKAKVSPDKSHPSFPEQVAIELAKPNFPERLLPPLPAAVEQSAREGAVVPHRYILKNIRLLLIELTRQFNEEELRQLYFDVPHFKPAHQQLHQSNGKVEIIDRLLEYAEQTLQLDVLLSLAKEHNLAIYEKHKPYYKLATLQRDLLPGSMVGKYSIVGQLGQGGMADVYKAYQSGLARFVAIKLIHSHLLEQEEFIERFEHEALAVARLRHPNIVQVFDFDREEDQYYMVMEYVAGRTLRAELEEHREKGEVFSLLETVEIFNALVDAIHYAHSQGIIHRDLKPGNVMFTPERRVVLTDFGIARVMDNPSYTMSNAIIGTPAYMSPEQAQSLPVDQRTDIYSLGVILYEMTTGHAPFRGDKPITIILKLVSGSLTSPTAINPDLPAIIEKIILKAMHRDPDERYQSAAEMAQAVQAAMALLDDQTQESRRAVMSPKAEEENPAKLQAWSGDQQALQSRNIPEIKISTDEVQPGLRQSSGGVNISNKGQLVFGGERAVQIGDISGGQVNIGTSAAVQPLLQGQEDGPEMTEFQQIFAPLKNRIRQEASPENRTAALERISELEEAIIGSTPDLDTISYVKGWFSKNIPSLADDVAQIIRHPMVGELIALAGARFANEFQRRFGI